MHCPKHEDCSIVYCEDDYAYLKGQRDRLKESVNAWRRLAKTACDAFEDLMQVCQQPGRAGGSPRVIMHLDDWKRLQNWKTEIHSAQCDADKAYAQRDAPENQPLK